MGFYNVGRILNLSNIYIHSKRTGFLTACICLLHYTTFSTMTPNGGMLRDSYILVTIMGLRLTSSCYGHTLKLYNGECTDNAARTKDKHQSDSEERHTRELHKYIAVPR